MSNIAKGAQSNQISRNGNNHRDDDDDDGNDNSTTTNTTNGDKNDTSSVRKKSKQTSKPSSSPHKSLDANAPSAQPKQRLVALYREESDPLNRDHYCDRSVTEPIYFDKRNGDVRYGRDDDFASADEADDFSDGSYSSDSSSSVDENGANDNNDGDNNNDNNDVNANDNRDNDDTDDDDVYSDSDVSENDSTYDSANTKDNADRYDSERGIDYSININFEDYDNRHDHIIGTDDDIPIANTEHASQVHHEPAPSTASSLPITHEKIRCAEEPLYGEELQYHFFYPYTKKKNSDLVLCNGISFEDAFEYSRGVHFGTVMKLELESVLHLTFPSMHVSEKKVFVDESSYHSVTLYTNIHIRSSRMADVLNTLNAIFKKKWLKYRIPMLGQIIKHRMRTNKIYNVRAVLGFVGGSKSDIDDMADLYEKLGI